MTCQFFLHKTFPKSNDLRKETNLKDKNKKEQSKNNRSFVIGKSSMTITRKSINIQTPKLILHQQKQNSENKCQE